jgi:Flp pilus assembly protein CpaB
LVLREPTKYLEERRILPQYAPKGCFGSIDAVMNDTLGKDVTKGTWILKSDLWNLSDWDTTLNVVKARGQVTCTIRIYSEFGGGWMPFDRVNVRLRPNGQEHASARRLILQKILILASDIPIVRDANDHETAAEFVTVAVTREQAEELKRAMTEGKLELFVPTNRPETLEDLIKQSEHNPIRSDGEFDH